MLLVFKTFVLGLWDKVGVYVLMALGAFALLFKYGYDKKKEGANELRSDINQKSMDVMEKWAEIDSRTPNVDDALDRLRRNNKD